MAILLLAENGKAQLIPALSMADVRLRKAVRPKHAITVLVSAAAQLSLLTDMTQHAKLSIPAIYPADMQKAVVR